MILSESELLKLIKKGNQKSFGKKNRNLQLNGEAFFEVAKNKKIQFIVQPSNLNMIAMGNRFNVQAYYTENTIETTLVDGAVKLESSTVKLADNIILKPNKKAVFTKKSESANIESIKKTEEKSIIPKPKLEDFQSIETTHITSSEDQQCIIQNEKLGQLAIKLERRFNVNFIFDDEVLKEFYFGGTPENENLEQTFQAISFASPIGYVIQDNNVTIM